MGGKTKQRFRTRSFGETLFAHNEMIFFTGGSLEPFPCPSSSRPCDPVGSSWQEGLRGGVDAEKNCTEEAMAQN